MPIVNYVREHRRFIRYASDEKLTASERLLWYALMEIFNQEAEGNAWPDDFIRISNNRLLAVLEPMGIDTMVRARNALKQHGRIDFRPGNRNRLNPSYRMIYFYPDGYTQNAGNNVVESGFYTQNAYNMGDNIHVNMHGNKGGNVHGNMPINMGDIYINQNKEYTETKTGMDENDYDEDDDLRARMCGEDPIPDRAERTEAARDGFIRAFGRTPYPAEVNRLVVVGWRCGFSSAMITKALEIAAGNGALKPVEYTLTILDEWRQEKVMQPHQIDEYRVEYGMQTGRDGLFSTGDVIEDMRIRDENRRKRAKENAEAGITRPAAEG